MPKGLRGFQKGHPNYVIEWNKKQKGIHYSPATEFRKGQIPWNKGKKWSNEMREKMKPHLKRIHEKNRGHRWKNHIHKTELSERIKKSYKWKLWREAVFKRDNWTCQECGEKGGKLHPHHRKSRLDFPELIFDVDYGITLCKKCHKKTDSYGWNGYNKKKVLLFRSL